MEWNVSLETIWNKVRHYRQLTPDIFMNIVFEIYPNLDESHIIAWTRALKVSCWERDICDFIWVYWKWSRENRKEWRQHIDRMWPKIETTLKTQHLTHQFLNMGF